MKHSPYALDADRPAIVLEGIVTVAARRGWVLWAAHVRTEHVHVFLSATGAAIDRVMNDLKGAASFQLNRTYPADRGRPFWARHGSTRYVWNETQLAAVVDYVLNHQGQPMAVYRRVTDQSRLLRSTPLALRFAPCAALIRRGRARR